jgi:hypothetical protein
MKTATGNCPFLVAFREIYENATPQAAEMDV